MENPVWIPEYCELRVGTSIVKKFTAPAPNQSRILAAFQEEGWPEWINDPLSPDPNIEPKKRLNDTVKQMNSSQHAPLLRFRITGSGTVIRWEWRDE